MRKILITLLVFFSLFQLQAQTEKDVISEANRLEINSKEDAIKALKNKGISLDQAKAMAKLRGQNFDTFLEGYLKSKSKTSESFNTASKKDVVSEMKIVPLDSLPIKEPVVKEEEIKKYFGYDIFENNPFGQKEYLVGNIDEGYILAPGDELRITVFGDNNLELVSTIDLNGNISFPNLGVFLAAGNSFATLKSRIKIFLGKYYSGLLSTPTRTFLDVSLTQIRPVQVSVLGNVNTPGPHLVSGMASVLNALYASGGINTSGTLRAVKVFRNNKLIKTIDLYDFITQGNIDNDIRLSNNDVLFVGPRLSSITLTGKVKKSAIYELKSTESLKDLFAFSGGLSSEASTSNINISRIKPFNDRNQEFVFDRFLTTVNYADFTSTTKKDLLLTDGDVVDVQAILDKQKNEVSIAGNVFLPGTFSLGSYKDLRTLIIAGAKGIKPNTYLQKIDINKVDENGVLSYKTYNLSSVLNKKITVSLEENDLVKIYSLEEVRGAQKVTISGFGVGEKVIFLKRMDSIKNAALEKISLEKTSLEEFYLEGLPQKDLQKRNQSLRNQSQKKNPITEELVDEKTLFLRANLSLFDLIFQSVSFEELEFQSKVLSSRLDLKRFDSNTGMYTLTKFSFDDLETLKSIYLQPKDHVILYSKSVTEDITPTVSINGNIKNSGTFPLLRNLYVEDLIMAAGGFLETAETGFVYLNRIDRDLKKGTYSKMKVNELDLEYMLGNKQTPSNPFLLQNYDLVTVVAPIRANFQPVVTVSGEVRFPRKVVLENDQTNISSLIDLAGGLTNNSNIESSYVERDSIKLYLNLKKFFLDNKTNLQDGDILHVGSRLNSVKTEGGVKNPSIFNWQEGKRAKYYLKRSGGTKKRIESMFVQQANGQSNEIGFLKNPMVYPGAQIIVTEKPEKIASDKSFLDEFIKVFSVLTSALTSIVLISKL